MKTLKIKDVFSDAPGGRIRSDGPKSGQEFREDILITFFKEIKTNEKGIIDLDGCFGYATSFLEEAFGGLARKYGSKSVLERLDFISEEEPRLIVEIREYIRNANE